MSGIVTYRSHSLDDLAFHLLLLGCHVVRLLGRGRGSWFFGNGEAPGIHFEIFIDDSRDHFRLLGPTSQRGGLESWQTFFKEGLARSFGPATLEGGNLRSMNACMSVTNKQRDSAYSQCDCWFVLPFLIAVNALAIGWCHVRSTGGGKGRVNVGGPRKVR